MRILKNLIIIFTLFLFALSFYQVSTLTYDLYLLKVGKTKLEKLSQEIREIEIELSKRTSLSRLDEFLAKSGLKEAKNFKFIEVLESGMAAK